MKRNRKFVRNCIIICSILFSVYYFGNFYFSKEECLKDMMTSLYLNDYEIVDEIQIGNEIHYVTINHEEKTLSIIDILDYEFLYRKQEIYKEIVHKFNDNYKYDIYGHRYQAYDYCLLYVLYRNDKEVQKIEFVSETGETYTFDEWNGDFLIASFNFHPYQEWDFNIYDKDGNFVDYYEDLN